MNTLRTIGYAICITLVVTSIFMMLLPSGHMTKIVKFAVHLFLLIAIVTPFIGKPIDFSAKAEAFTWEQNETAKSLNELADEQLLRSFEKSLRLQAEAVFKKYEIAPEKIEFNMNVRSDRSIDISKLEILLKGSDKDRCDKAVRELNEMFGVTAVLAFTDGT